MDSLPPLTTSLPSIILPTFHLYAPHLHSAAPTIRSLPPKTSSYGPHPRQQLDVYTPPSPSMINNRHAILLIFYSGGFVNGSKTLPMPFLDGLVYANVASFFALKCGYTVVVADYRLLGDGARFPSGGEDVAMAVEWVGRNKSGLGLGMGESEVDLFLLGNSAGGVHVATFLLRTEFEETRRRVLEGEGTSLRGVVLLSAAFSFPGTSEGDPATVYLGDVEQHAPSGLLKTALQGGEGLDFVQAGVRLLVLTCELDPEELWQSRDEFIKVWTDQVGSSGRAALAVDVVKGHNHISPMLALGTETEKEEAWGYQVASFCDNIRKYTLS
ncbi:Alpha/Beta hydrolase protein [Elsinoe ampelina]|uniref:Alpha/Beta hydrolase protein n=1 Tax=Elsinoe ampelina TaxID=302913 RepID=A0A6A6G2E5_9PEZI|nr:Alpha/Beta hydrolase protein [Elsinoe ampelina]